MRDCNWLVAILNKKNNRLVEQARVDFVGDLEGKILRIHQLKNMDWKELEAEYFATFHTHKI